MFIRIVQIRFMVDGFAPSENAYKNARGLFDRAIAETKCAPEAVTELIITDADHFGPAIHLLAPGLPYTANEDYAAVAKTITVGPDLIPVASAIVLRDGILGGAFDAIAKKYTERTADEQRFIYVIWHEVAHALDATLRPKSVPRATFITDPQGRFKIRHIASFYCEVLLSEIPACRFAAFTWNQAMADTDSRGDNAMVVKHLARVRSDVQAYRGDLEQLCKMAFSCRSGFLASLRPLRQGYRPHVGKSGDLHCAHPLAKRSAWSRKHRPRLHRAPQRILRQLPHCASDFRGTPF